MADEEVQGTGADAQPEPPESPFAEAARSSVDLGESHEAFVKARRDHKKANQVPSGETKNTPPQAEASTGPTESKDGSAAESVAATNGVPKAKRTASERARELLKEGRVDEAMKILERASSKRAKEPEEEPAKAQESRPAPSTAPPQATETPQEISKPKRIDFTSQVGGGRKYQTLEEAEDAYDDARDDWRKAETRRAEQAEAQRVKAVDFERRRSKAMSEGERRYDDFKQVISGDPQTGTGFLLRQDVLSAIISECDNVADLLYTVASDPAEKKRIMDLNGNPMRQWHELIKISEQLSSGSGGNGTAPTKKQAAVRPAAPPPPPHGVSGVDGGFRPRTRTDILANENYTDENHQAEYVIKRMQEKRAASGRR